MAGRLRCADARAEGAGVGEGVIAGCSDCIVQSLHCAIRSGGRRKRCAAGPETTRADIRGGGWDELERYGAGKRGRGRVRGGSPLPASASARDNTGQGDVLAALGRQEVGRVRGRVLGRARCGLPAGWWRARAPETTRAGGRGSSRAAGAGARAGPGR